jgi:thioredoxin reductase (NADPH)
VITVDDLATIPLFSALAQNELEYLVGAVEDIHLIPGEYVADEGEGRFLAVVVEGQTELTKLVNGVEQVIGVRLPGELGGEIPMTLGTPLPASMQAVEPSRVLKVNVEVFHTLAAMAPQVSATVGAAALERLEMLRNATAQPLDPSMFVIGPPLDPEVHAAESFLHRNQIPHDHLDPDDPAAAARTGGGAAVAAPYPVVELRDGTRLMAPTMRVIATVAGLTVVPGRAHYDVIIVGGGPAGLTAAVNAASEGLQTALIESFAPGGQAGTSTRIENYTGFPSSKSQRKRTSGSKRDPRLSRCTETTSSRRSRSSIEGPARHHDGIRGRSSSLSAPKRRLTGSPRRSHATSTASS